MENTKRIIEINGVKMEIDLRNATVVENYKVGETIKLLRKDYSSYSSHAGVIVGFDEFKEHPTIVIAYLEIGYDRADIKFAYYNSESKDLEICKIQSWDIPYSKQTVIDKIDREIAKKEQEVIELQTKKNVFLELFGKYFENKINISE
jgi:hypothetical protein